MFNFYVVLTGYDKVTGTGRATTCRRKPIAPWLETNVQNKKDLLKTWVLTGKQFEGFRLKKRTELLFSAFQKNPVEHTALKSN